VPGAARRYGGEAVRIEVLYIPGCPNYEPAVERLQALLDGQSLEAEICSVAIKTEAQAEALLFPGSPTIRIDGRDVEQLGTVASGLVCRLYANRSGIPSEELLRIAISNAKQKE
jgi:hypothetical protein